MRLVGVILQSRRSGVEAVERLSKSARPLVISKLPIVSRYARAPDGASDKEDSMERIMRISEVIQVTGLSKTTIWRRVKDEEFPAPVRLGRLATRSVGWRESEVKGWLGSRPVFDE